MNGLVGIQADQRWQHLGIDAQQGVNVLLAVGEVVAAEAENATLAQLLDEVAFQQPACGIQLLGQGIESTHFLAHGIDSEIEMAQSAAGIPCTVNVQGQGIF